MLAWLQANGGTLAVGIVLLVLLIVIARHVIKEKKRGGGCSCGCGACAMRDSCHGQTKK